MEDIIIQTIEETANNEILENIYFQISELNTYLQLLVYLLTFVFTLYIAFQVWKYIRSMLRSYIKLNL